MLPLYTEKPYAPQDTQNVIINLLMIAITPYQMYAPIFHILTILIIALIFWQPARMGRVLAAYIGLNYIVIALVQTMGTTLQYGFVLHIGGMIMYGILGLTWIVVSVRNELQTSFHSVPWRHFWLLPFALLAFWAPYTLNGNIVKPDFNPLLLLISPDYGMTFCLTTPVFLFLLILFYPRINSVAYLITAFNGLLYGIFNLSHWLKPELRWMGFLHIPLLLISIYAIILPWKERKRDNKSLQLTPKVSLDSR
jgi:drug/metabolite transporter superfamily protein YnfA